MGECRMSCDREPIEGNEFCKNCYNRHKAIIDNLEDVCHKNNSIKESVTKKAIDIITDCASNTGYILYAKQEMELAYGKFENMDSMQKLMCEQIIELLSVFSTQGDSGSTITYKLDLLNRLIKRKPISKLTFNDNEFYKASSGLWQNKRMSSIFKNDEGVITWLDAVTGITTKSIYSDSLEVQDSDVSCTYGYSSFIITECGIIKHIKYIAIRPETFKEKTFTISRYEIEYPSGWWISFHKEKDLVEVANEYDIVYDTDNVTHERLEKELSFKDNVYREELLKRIDILKFYLLNNW